MMCLIKVQREIIIRSPTRNFISQCGMHTIAVQISGRSRNRYLDLELKTAILNYLQILDVDQYLLVSAFIQSKIDDLDLFIAMKEKEQKLEELSVTASEESSRQFHLGSAQKKVRLSKFEALHSHDIAYNNFQRKLANHLTTFLQAYSIPLPNNKQIKIQLDDTVMFHSRLVALLLNKL